MNELERLGFTKHDNIAVEHLPAELEAQFSQLHIQPEATTATDLLVLFGFSVPQIKTALARIADAHSLTENGTIYLLYPKMASKRYPGVNRDALFNGLSVNEDTGEVAATGLKFSRMRSFNADFTMVDLKWLASSPRPRTTPSQRVADYVERIPELQSRLQHTSGQQRAATFFEQLTPGYKREWARYIYAPVREATQTSHFEQMLTALNAGAPNWETYQKQQK